MSVIILEDEIVHYEVLGRGRPLIFLHGWVGSWRYWIPTMQAASASYRAYAIDLWGFGDSAKNNGRYSLEQQADLVASFMDKMGISRTVLIGHSLGALVALLFANHYPELVDRILAIGVPANSQLINPRLLTSSPTEMADWLLGRLPAMETARMEAPRADYQSILTSINNFYNLNIPDLLSNLTIPTLLVQGQNDPAISSEYTEDMVNLPELTHQIIFEGSGHFPMLEEMNKFNRLLVDFLSLSSGESPRHLQLKDEWKRRVR
jgi:pimeloyl-ACP methyl ester carboxylesterase